MNAICPVYLTNQYIFSTSCSSFQCIAFSSWACRATPDISKAAFKFAISTLTTLLSFYSKRLLWCHRIYCFYYPVRSKFYFFMPLFHTFLSTTIWVPFQFGVYYSVNQFIVILFLLFRIMRILWPIVWFRNLNTSSSRSLFTLLDLDSTREAILFGIAVKSQSNYHSFSSNLP